MFGSGAFLSERFIGAFQTSCIENSERFSERSLSEMLGNDRIFRSAHTYKYLHFFWNATVEKRGNIPNAHAEICQGKNQAAGARKNAFSLGSLLLRRCRSGSRNGQNWLLHCVIYTNISNTLKRAPSEAARKRREAAGPCQNLTQPCRVSAVWTPLPWNV